MSGPGADRGELAVWGERVWAHLLRALPLHAYTRALRVLGGVPVPRGLREPVFGRVASALGIDVSDAELPVSGYRTFSELFVRRLRSGARPVDASPGVLISPVDALLTTRGEVRHGSVVQAKGIDFSLAQLLGDAAVADAFEGGQFFTLYLRPKDYHRIHSPISGRLLQHRRLGGRLLPVKPYMVENVGDLLACNERLWFLLEGDLGCVAVVCVAAAGVGTVTTSAEVSAGDGQLRRGQELAAFNIGSTVVVFLEAGHWVPEPLPIHAQVRVGQPLARWRSDEPAGDRPGRAPGGPC